MSEKMPEERLAELRTAQRREYNRMVAEIDPPTWEYDAFNDMLAEIDRLHAELAAKDAEIERLREAIEAWCDADRACEELIDGDNDLAPAETFSARIRALHDAQDGVYVAIGRPVPADNLATSKAEPAP